MQANGRKEQIDTFFDLEESLEERLLVLPLERALAADTTSQGAALIQEGDERRV